MNRRWWMTLLDIIRFIYFTLICSKITVNKCWGMFCLLHAHFVIYVPSNQANKDRSSYAIVFDYVVSCVNYDLESVRFLI